MHPTFSFFLSSQFLTINSNTIPPSYAMHNTLLTAHQSVIDLALSLYLDVLQLYKLFRVIANLLAISIHASEAIAHTALAKCWRKEQGGVALLEDILHPGLNATFEFWGVDIEPFLANGSKGGVGDLPGRHPPSHGLLNELLPCLLLRRWLLFIWSVLEAGRTVALRVLNVCIHEAGAQDGNPNAGTPECQFMI